MSNVILLLLLLQSLMRTAKEVRMESLCGRCCEYLKQHDLMNPDNCLAVLDLAETYGPLELKQDALKYTCQHFPEVIFLTFWGTFGGKPKIMKYQEMLKSDFIRKDVGGAKL